MEFNQVVVIEAPRQKVWDFIWSVEEFAACVPGVTQVERVDDEHFKVRIEQKISFLKAVFNINIEIQEKRAPEYIRTTGEGADSQIAASLKQKTEVLLEILSDSQTKMSIRSSVDVFGKLGSLGFSVIKNQANKVFADFAQKVKAKLE